MKKRIGKIIEMTMIIGVMSWGFSCILPVVIGSYEIGEKESGIVFHLPSKNIDFTISNPRKQKNFSRVGEKKKILWKNGHKYVFWKEVYARVTAYSPDKYSCGRFADGRTAIGKNAWCLDGIAADPRIIPYGTLVEIPGIGIKIVDDTGSAMKKSSKKGIIHLDIRMLYPYQCRKWGIRWSKVKLYRRVND